MTSEIAKSYVFVRRKCGDFEHTEFTCHEDGSAGFVADGAAHIFECDPEAWRRALAALEAKGFVELSEARASGFVPGNWHPTPETSAYASCGRVSVVPLADGSNGKKTKG